MNWKHWCVAVACAGFMAVGCGDDNPSDPGDGDGGGGSNTPTTTPPREWQGTWAGTTTTIDIEVAKGSAVADTTVDTDTLTICDKGITGGEVPFGCVWFIGEDSIDVDCDTMIVFVDNGDTCTFDASIVATGKRTGTSFSISGRQTTMGTGQCGEDTNEDVLLTATYTRINSTVPECGDDIPEDTTEVDTTDTGGGNTGDFVGTGEYETRVRVWFCGAGSPVSDTRDTSSICPGDSASDFDDDFEQNGIECDIDIGESTISVTCSGEINDVETGCTITTSNSYNGTFDDDSYDMTGGGTISASGSGEFCDLIPDQCFEFEVNGRRLSTTPSDCPDAKVSPEAATGLDPEVIAAIVKSKVEAALRSAADQSR